MVIKRRLKRLEGGRPKEPQRSKLAEEINNMDREILAIQEEISLEESLMTPDELSTAKDAAVDQDTRLAGLTTAGKIARLEAVIAEQEE